MKGTKKERLTQFNKENIIEAAEKLFEKKGIDSTTMDDIAKKADYSKSTIYVYFKSKDEIYNNIVYMSMKKLREQMKDILDKSYEIKECYKSICYMFVDFEKNNSIYFKSILGEIPVDDESVNKSPILYDIFLEGENINKLLAEMIEKGIQQGKLREDINVFATINMLWASVGGIINIASQKEAYFKLKHNLSKEEFLEDSFETLYRSIEKGAVI